MSASQIATYVGRGQAYLGAYDGSTPMLPVGNCSKLVIAVAEKKLSMPDYINPGGGEYDSVHLIDSVGVQMSLMDLLPANMMLALFGTTSVTTAGPVTGEEHNVGVLGGLVPLDNIPDPTVPIVVKSLTDGPSAVASAEEGNTGTGTIGLTGSGVLSGAQDGIYLAVCTVTGTHATFAVKDPNGVAVGNATADTAFATQIGFTIATGGTAFVLGDTFKIDVTNTTSEPTTYVAGTDYTQTRSGFVTLTTGTIPANSNVVVGYTSLSSNNVQGLTQTGQSYKMVFEGLNEANSGQPVIAQVFNIKFSPGKELALISDAFSQIDVDGEALKDLAITTPGLSQYLTIQQAIAPAS